jgi:cyclohexyl-isocyanide hydratase
VKIKKLNKSFNEEYVNLMVRAVEQQPESFRISVADVSGAPPFAVETDDDFTLGALDEAGKLTGVVSFAREKQEKLRHKGLIYRMYVASSSAGKGIGRGLLRAAIAEAQKIEGLERINLTVVASNERAKNLYKSEGFISFSLEKRAIKIGVTYFDEETMALSFEKG